MIREYIEKIKAGDEVRKNLIALKAECKELAGKHAVLYALNNQVEMFFELLKAEDPKIRKNAALIIGQLGVQEGLEHLYEAYVKETTMFVRSSYLTAMRELDYRAHIDDLKERLAELKAAVVEEASQKHVVEETRILQELVLTMEGRKKHTFVGYHEPSRIILLTNRNYRELTADKLKSHRPKVFNAGVQAYTDNLEEILEVRTFSELLFLLEDKGSLRVKEEDSVDAKARSLAKQIGESSLVEFLEKRHKGDTPYYFRIECKSKMDLKQKSTFTKKLSAYLEKESKDALINSTSHYEVELRLVENKQGNFNFLIKLYTMKDPRFTYRREALATSIQPVNAALAMELAGEYLREGAQVLDPFCGVGTMLVERNRYKDTGDLYGIDIYGKGIEHARENTANAGIRVNYINRDFFDFTHEYLFDEVISNMPRVMGQKTTKDIHTLYKKFWDKIQDHIKKDSVLVLYCYDSELLESTLPKDIFEIKEKFEISKREGAYVYVIQGSKS